MAQAKWNRGSGFRLIAHRGGVVEGQHPENSEAAVVGAIERGYAMVEIDVRLTADGQIVCFHDNTVRRRPVGRIPVHRLTLAELRSRAGGWVLTLEQMVDICDGRISIMLDTKSDPVDVPGQDDFLKRVYATLDRSGLLRTAYCIGSQKSKEFFRGSAYTAVLYKELTVGERTLKSIGPAEFLFGHGNEIDPKVARTAVELGVRLVASVNRFHYFPRRATYDAAIADIRALVEAGCTEFQIDSEYDRFFAEPTNALR